MKFLKKLNLTVVVFCVCCIAFVAFLAYNPSHAYFEVHKDAIGVNTAKVDLLFDKYDESVFTLENNEDSLAEEDRTYKGPELNQSAEWGTEANPYIIRKKNHINNLAMLQKAGYFADKSGQSFFVVCDLVGKPVAINCSEDSEMEIAPIGTPSNPFTGNISGAYISGTATYGSYSVSQSTIANLTIIAGEETPDIGFFGALGYVGTYNKGTDATETTAEIPPYITPLNGKLYNATLDNLLFADITVTDSQIAGVFTTWWGKFADDKAHDANKETHHVGIVAGHSEWATLSNLSVYYSPSTTDSTTAKVAAFQLNGKSSNETSNPSSNYYSITGILGTLEYTNPTKEYDTNNVLTKLDGKNAINDEDLAEELLTGGGGDESGIMTGYMRAENIFSRKDAANPKTELKPYVEAYDVKYLTEDKASFFSSVDLTEGLAILGNAYRYYYFSDSIFTFAMSSRATVRNNTATPADGKIDYLVKIWDLESDDASRLITATANDSDWTYRRDESISKFAYKLKAATTIQDGKTYVLAYRVPGTNGESDTFYVFDMNGGTGYVSVMTPETFTISSTIYTTTYIDNDPTKGVSEMYLTSAKNDHLPQSFIYNKSFSGKVNYSTVNYTAAFASSEPDSEIKFGISAEPNKSNNSFGTPTIYVGTATRNTEASANLGASTSFWYDFKMSLSSTPNVPSNTVTIGGTSTLSFRDIDWGGIYYNLYLYNFKLAFDTTNKKFSVLGLDNPKILTDQSSNSTTQQPYETTVAAPYTQDLLLFEVTTQSITLTDVSNILPSESTDHFTFDPSKEILFADDANGTSYTVTPLEVLKWNNGSGEYLKQLNHAVKLASATTFNQQLNFKNLIGDNTIGNFLQSFIGYNSGGVVTAPIGIKSDTYYTIPAGMIAFDIRKASEAEPSYINIVVAVNPEETTSPTIGLYGPMDNAAWNSTFNIENPAQSFKLPISKTANNQSDYATYKVTLSGYYGKTTDDKGKVTYAEKPTDATLYTYLGGKIVLVGYTFKVTQPSIYLLGARNSPMTVCYFSVDGAAGSGGDGTGGSPLGNIDFVYDNNNTTTPTIISVDKKFVGAHITDSETPETYYYPSYYYVRTMPVANSITVSAQTMHIRRYITASPAAGYDRRRYIRINNTNTTGTTHVGILDMYEDILDSKSTGYPTT